MIIRPLKPDDRAGWEPLWQGYLRFYETRLGAEVTDLTFARLTGGADPMGAFVAEAELHHRDRSRQALLRKQVRHQGVGGGTVAGLTDDLDVGVAAEYGHDEPARRRRIIHHQHMQLLALPVPTRVL